MVAPAIVSQNYSSPKKYRDKSHRRDASRSSVPRSPKAAKFGRNLIHTIYLDSTPRVILLASVSDRRDDRCGGSGRLKNSLKKMNSLLCSNGRAMSLNLKKVIRTYYIRCNINMQNILYNTFYIKKSMCIYICINNIQKICMLYIILIIILY